MNRLSLLCFVVAATATAIFIGSCDNPPPVAPLIRVASNAEEPVNNSPTKPAIAARPPQQIAAPTRPASNSPAQSFAATEAFQSWTDRFAQTPATQRAEMHAEGLRIAKARRSEFSQAMRETPERALAMAVPIATRRILPPEIVAQLETPVDARGDLEHYAAIPQPGVAVPPDSYSAQIGGRNLRAYVTAERRDQPSRYRVPIHGYQLDAEIVVRPTAGRLLEPIEVAEHRAAKNTPAICPASKLDTQALSDEAAIITGTDTQLFCSSAHATQELEALTAAEMTAAAGAETQAGEITVASTHTEGVKTILFIRIDYSNWTSPPVDGAVILPYIASDWAEWSYGKCTVNTAACATTPILRMPNPVEYYDGNNSGVYNDALAAATAAGYTPGNYSFVMVCMDNNTPGFSWAGLGTVGGNKTWLRAEGSTYAAQVATHELGHNLGLNHAQSYTVGGTNPIASGGTTSEYGDPYDTMGNGNYLSAYGARYKLYLNWLTAADIPSATTSGIYRIAAHDKSTATGIRGLKVARTASQDYCLEYRSERSGSQATYNDVGVQVRWAPSGTGNGKAQLLDMTSGSSNGLTDAPLAVGRTFADAQYGIFLTTLAKVTGASFDSMDVLVNVNDTLPPPPWTSGDIGTVGAAGVATFSGTTHLVYGAGADIWGTADEFQFVRQSVTGNCDIRARVPLQANTNAWAKAGVMLRDGTAAGAMHAAVYVTPGNGFSMQYRNAVNGSSAGITGPALNAAPNNWVRLTRAGNVLTGYVSADGSAWTQIGTVTIAMPSAIQGGLAVCSHVDADLGAVKFDNVSIADMTPLTVTANDTFDAGVPTIGNDAGDPLDVAWTSTSALSLAADTTIATGNALNLDATGAFAVLTGAFSPRSLVELGDSLKLSFDFRYTQAVTNVGSGFRFGLFNTSGDGFGVQHGTGGSTGWNIVEDTAADGGYAAGSTVTTLTSGTKTTLNDQLKHTATLTIKKVATGLSITTVVDGATLTATDATPVISTFDTIAIRNGNQTADFRADNIKVEFSNNLAPAWAANPLNKPSAFATSAYDSTVAGEASDANPGDSVSFSKVSGPAWLVVSANGDLSGTPAAGDVGTNVFTVRATDASGLTADATLNITVVTAAVANYWDGSGTSWNAAANWSTASGSSTPNPAAIPGAGNTARFNIAGVTAAQTVSLDADQSAAGMIFASSGTITLQGGGTNRVLVLGTGGLAVNAGAGAATIGSAVAGQNVSLALGAPQFWTNASATLLTIQNGVDLGSVALTVAGSGNSAINGVISGSGAVTKTGSGTLTLAGANTYTSTTSLSGGTLVVKHNTALGATSAGTTIASGATLDVQGTAANSLNLGVETLTISGAGVGGNGVIVNNGAFSQTNAVQRLALSGNATIGGATRWDVRGSGSTLSGAFTLTKAGANQVSLVNTTVTIRDLVITAGSLTLEVGTNFSDAAPGAITVGGSGTLGVGSYGTAITVTKPIFLTAGAKLTTTSTGTNGNATIAAPVSLEGASLIGPRSGSTLTLSGGLLGDGGFTLNDSGTLVLSGVNDYGGETVVSAGVLSITSATFSDTAAIRISNSAILNLAHAATDTVDRLYINGTLQETGVWGAVGSGAAHETSSITGSGRLQVINGVTPFDTWAATNGLSGTAAAKDADPDGDGVPNYMEMALNGDPNSAQSFGRAVPRIQSVNGALALTYTIATRSGAVFAPQEGRQTASASGLVYTIEASSDLENWGTSETVMEVTPALTSGLPALPSGWEYHTFRSNSSLTTASRAFIRAQIEAP